MTELMIRKGSAADIDAIAALEQECFASPWSRESLYHDLAENQLSTYFVAELQGQIVGYVGIWMIMDEGHVNNVAVSPSYRRQHIGSALIAAMLRSTEEAGIKSHTLEVRAGNRAAKGLYENYGFKEAGVRKGYYEDNGEDGIIMWRY